MKDCLFILVVAILGLGSDACGYIAEAKRPKRDDTQLQGGECVYPMSGTLVLGFVGAALLAVSSITGCCKRGENVSTRKFALGILYAVISWLLALYTVLLFVLAAAAYKPGMRGKAPECYTTYLHVDRAFRRAAFQAKPIWPPSSASSPTGCFALQGTR